MDVSTTHGSIATTNAVCTAVGGTNANIVAVDPPPPTPPPPPTITTPTPPIAIEMDVSTTHGSIAVNANEVVASTRSIEAPPTRARSKRTVTIAETTTTTTTVVPTLVAYVASSITTTTTTSTTTETTTYG